MPEKKKPASKNIASQLSGVIGRVANKVNQITGDAKGTIIKQIDTALERKHDMLQEQIAKKKEELRGINSGPHQRIKNSVGFTKEGDTMDKVERGVYKARTVLGAPERGRQKDVRNIEGRAKDVSNQLNDLVQQRKDLSQARSSWNSFKSGKKK